MIKLETIELNAEEEQFVNEFQKNNKTIKVKKVNPNAIIPTRGDGEAAGIDLYVCLDEAEDEFGVPMDQVMIMSGETYIFDTGIAFELPKGYFGAVYVRSSIGIKNNLRLMNGTGIIDNSFRGTVKVALHNFGNTPQVIKHGDRIAQMVLLPYVTFPIVEVDTLTETERGEGGIGSTGR